MATKSQPTFDPKVFLAHVGKGRSIDTYRKGKIVFSQGEPADAVWVREHEPGRIPSNAGSRGPDGATTGGTVAQRLQASRPLADDLDLARQQRSYRRSIERRSDHPPVAYASQTRTDTEPHSPRGWLSSAGLERFQGS